MAGNVTERLQEIISNTLAAMGYDLVRVQITGKDHITMQIMAERCDEKAMTVDDCAAISREISPILDIEDPLADAYSLEVSSPGIDRPLVFRKDYERYAGFEISAEASRPIADQRKFRGKLLGLEGDSVLIRQGDVTTEIPFDDIRKAKLVVTDELLESHARLQA